MVQSGVCVLLFTEGSFWVFYLKIVCFHHQFPQLTKISQVTPQILQNPQSVKRNLGKYLPVKILIRVMSVNQW